MGAFALPDSLTFSHDCLIRPDPWSGSGGQADGGAPGARPSGREWSESLNTMYRCPTNRRFSTPGPHV